MNCFRHRETASVGICTYCGRGMCPDCAREIEATAVACSDQCAEGIRKTRALVAANQRLVGGGGGLNGLPTSTLTYGVVGLFAFGFGIYAFTVPNFSFMAWYCLLFGGVSLFNAYLIFRRTVARRGSA
ncbi:MAG: hypothetical protein JF625_13385 [Inquilinus limosus]|uniref:B box-type domain-containing protein n=1 Tax=Inquilinus limosus TaxID=171674 RepID=A0A952FP44_9PROT|nr:hypothetical protein [Inquilinus limosus]